LAGAVSVQLHGLPLGSTLVLIDGHPTNTGGFSFVDVGTIPPEAVERIEILPVGSSAIYGSDALAGVINIVLRKDFSGADANVKYGRAAGTHTTSADVSFGKNWERGGVSLTATVSQQTPLMGSERSATSTTNLESISSILDGDDCFPGNVYSLNGQN